MDFNTLLRMHLNGEGQEFRTPLHEVHLPATDITPLPSPPIVGTIGSTGSPMVLEYQGYNDDEEHHSHIDYQPPSRVGECCLSPSLSRGLPRMLKFR